MFRRSGNGWVYSGNGDLKSKSLFVQKYARKSDQYNIFNTSCYMQQELVGLTNAILLPFAL